MLHCGNARSINPSEVAESGELASQSRSDPTAFEAAPARLSGSLSVAEDRGLAPRSQWDRTDFQSLAAPRQLCLPTTKLADGARSAKMAQPERSEGDERGCPRSGRREEQTRGHAPQRPHGSPISLQTSPGALVRFRLRGPDGRNCTRTTAFEARQAVCYLTPGKWCARPELHGHFSGLGPRSTVCCRRAHGWRGRSRTDNSR